MSEPSTQNSLMLMWRNLGPYHRARARAAAARFGKHGVATVVLELCGAEETRDWESQLVEEPFRVVTIRPEDRLDADTPDMSGDVLAVLNETRPQWIAVAGYDRPEMRRTLRWGVQNGATTVLMSETKWDDRPRPCWKRWAASRIVRGVDAGLVSGAAAGEYLVALGMPRERIFRQYGAIDNDYFHKHAASRRTPGGTGYFLACCRLIESRKNIQRLISAYAGYREQTREPWGLVICGDGPDRPMYERRIDREGIRGVTFAGFQQVESLSKYYAGASCFVHPAINEAWGLVVNEAMASGLPVLVSRRCGCAYDLVHEGINGFTFDPCDVPSLTRLLVQYSNLEADRRESMGQSSQRIISRFGCDQFAAGLEAALNTGGGAIAFGTPEIGQADTEEAGVRPLSLDPAVTNTM